MKRLKKSATFNKTFMNITDEIETKIDNCFKHCTLTSFEELNDYFKNIKNKLTNSELIQELNKFNDIVNSEVPDAETEKEQDILFQNKIDDCIDQLNEILIML